MLAEFATPRRPQCALRGRKPVQRIGKAASSQGSTIVMLRGGEVDGDNRRQSGSTNVRLRRLFGGRTARSFERGENGVSAAGSEKSGTLPRTQLTG